MSSHHLLAKAPALYHLRYNWTFKTIADMATFMTLPIELRLQIYRELFVSTKPRGWRMAQRVRRPVTCYIDRTFNTAILEVNKKIYEEAKSILYGERTGRSTSSSYSEGARSTGLMWTVLSILYHVQTSSLTFVPASWMFDFSGANQMRTIPTSPVLILFVPTSK